MKLGKGKYKIELSLIGRYLSDEASSNDLSQLELWMNESEENEKTLNEYRILWDKTGSVGLFSDVNIDLEWKRFNDAISQEPVIVPPKSFMAFSGYFRYAAIIVIGLILTFSSYHFYNRIKYEKIVAGISVEKVDLPDGSKLSIYPGSHVWLPNSFNKNSRKLKLKGEAFFEVNPDPLKPFLVEAGHLNVKVLGTSFLVKSEKKSGIMEVVVETGKVSTWLKNQEPEIKVLLPGEKVVFDSSGENLVKTQNDDPNYLSWKTGNIVFKNSSLTEVASVLSKTFNLKIGVEDGGDCRITVTFYNKELKYILETLKSTLDITIKENSDEITLVSQDC